MASLKNILGPSDEAPQPSVRLVYDPVRKTPPYTVLRPYTSVELAQCQTSYNPLRTKPPPPTAAEHSTGTDGAVQSASKRIAESENGSATPSGHVRKRRRSNDDQEKVVGHYNSRPNKGIDERRTSPIIGLKAFNNWIKTVLIAKFARSENDPPEKPKVRVLDMGCGKGGDLMKWEKAGTELYVGVDVAKVSVEQARDRLRNMRRRTFDGLFHELDCFEDPIDEVLSDRVKEIGFNTVSMQFCLHYAWESEHKVRTMLQNVSKYLKDGGTFIGTIPDPEQLIPRLSEIPDDEEPSFGNSIYKVTFDDRDTTPRFGHRYTFFLEDAVEDVPEYVVYWDLFVSLAAEVGLNLVYCSDFTAIFNDEREDANFASLLKKMKVVDAEGNTEMDLDQFEAATMYLGFAFVKGERSGNA